jgi:hypothetical protein
MIPEANILVTVVPSLLAMTPPTSGVHVLFNVKADMRRLNSVFDVPKSRKKRDLSGPRTYEALKTIILTAGDAVCCILTNDFQYSVSTYTTVLRFG